MPWRASRLDPDDTLPEVDAQIAGASYVTVRTAPRAPPRGPARLLAIEQPANQTPKALQTLTDTGDTARRSRGDRRARIPRPVEARQKRRSGPITQPLAAGEQVIANEFDRAAPRAFSTEHPMGPSGTPRWSISMRPTVSWCSPGTIRAASWASSPPPSSSTTGSSPRPKPAARSARSLPACSRPPVRLPRIPPRGPLRRDLPRFAAGEGPPGGFFTDDLDRMRESARRLDGSYITVQDRRARARRSGTGPSSPTASFTVGRRVGICAISHQAIDNLLEEVVRVFSDEGDSRRTSGGPPGAASSPTRAAGDLVRDRQCAIPHQATIQPGRRHDVALLPAAIWKGPPDYVPIIDEAGQLALADALAASTSPPAASFSWGDPLQLPQVSQALHPGGGGPRPRTRPR